MKKIRAMCSIQDGSIGYKKIKQLESVLQSTYQSHFGMDNKIVFFWIKIPFEQAYLAGELSTASTVQIPVEDGTSNEKRHPFMSEVCVKWQHITGCNKDEIILVCPDNSAFTDFQNAMSVRHAEVATKVKLKMLFKFILGRLKSGYFNTTVNM